MKDGNPVDEVLEGHLHLARSLSSLGDDIEALADETVAVLRDAGRVLICGNGGSAAQSQHFSGELVGQFEEQRRGLPAFSLASDMASLTAIANDFGYGRTFARQVEAFGEQGDMLYGLSTSGDSHNVVEALEMAGERGMTTVGLAGGDGGRIVEVADRCVVVPSESTARIQEARLVVIHAICAMVDRAFTDGVGA